MVCYEHAEAVSSLLPGMLRTDITAVKIASHKPVSYLEALQE